MSTICLDCRRLLEDGEACAPSHRAVAPDDPALVDAVWKDAPRRREPRPEGLGEAAKMGALGLVVSVFVCATFSLCSGAPRPLDFLDGFWIFPAILSAIVVPALVYEQLASHGGTAGSVLRWLLHVRRPQPRGGVVPPVPQGVRGVVGRVSGEPVLRAPITGGRGVAWAAAVERHGQVFLRDARCADFRVEHEDGVVEIPAGPVEIVALDRSSGDARAWVDEIRTPADGREVFPGGRGWDATIRPGDQIEVIGELETVVDGRAADASYRDAPAVVWRPRGPVVLRQTPRG